MVKWTRILVVLSFKVIDSAQITSVGHGIAFSRPNNATVEQESFSHICCQFADKNTVTT